MRMTSVFLAFIAILVLVGAGCRITTPDKPKVAVTIFPIYDLVRIIGGEEVEAVLIVPSGASPHTFEPTPSLIKELKGTSRIFQIGHGLDNWTGPIASSVKNVKLVTLDKNVELLSATDMDEPGSDSFDPHYWMDPTNAYIMVDTIVHELSEIDPEHVQAFLTRAEEFKDELERKDFEWMKLMAEVTHKEIVTFHDAFMYFADHFQLDVVATFEPFPGREPTPQYLIDLQDGIKKYNVKILYMEPQLAGDSLQTFAHDNDLTIAILDPEGSEDRTSYLEMIDYNVKTILENQK